MEFIQSNLPLIIAIAAAFAFLFEKGYTLWTDKKKKQAAYNRLFVSLIKIYYSYLKHKKIYSEKPFGNLPDEVYALIAKHLDSFSNDLEEFRTAMITESEILPEFLIQFHVFFESIDRMRMIDKMKLGADPAIGPLSDEHSLIIKRAQFYAISEMCESFFDDMIIDFRRHTSVKTEFVNRLLYFKSAEYETEANLEQRNIFKRYFESLKLQNAIPAEAVEALMTSFDLK